jgi:DNA helicase-2/ATP-dependent DNA helicase PcrA
MPSVIPTTVNAEQRTAIEYGDGPLLIVAGAGTGKTTVITQRIAWLILEKKVPTDGILALTFTDKAATEMEERVDRLLPYGYVNLWISTFHAFAERVLRDHAIDIGLPGDFRLLSQTEQWLLIRRHLDRFELDYYRPLGNPTRFVGALLKHFPDWKTRILRRRHTWPMHDRENSTVAKSSLSAGTVESAKRGGSKK